MESSLKLILPAIAFIIIAGILWDAIRSRKNKMHSSWGNLKLSSMNQSYKEKQKFDHPEEYRAKDSSYKNIRDIDNVVNSRDTEHLSELNDDFLGNDVLDDEILVDNTMVANETVRNLHDTTLGQKRHKMSEQIIILHVMAKNENFTGTALAPVFENVNLHFGDMNIFHAHENLDGSGEILFSVASAVEPGYFEINQLDNLSIPGLVLFFKLNNNPSLKAHAMSPQCIATFELMLRTAKQMAKILNAEITDDKRKLLTTEKIEEYRGWVTGAVRANLQMA